MPFARHYHVMPKDSTTYSYNTTDLAAIYNFGPENVTGPRKKIVILSFGGGLYGTLNPDGTLTDGDCQKLWQQLNIAYPTPIVRMEFLGGSTNDLTSDAVTENSIDVQMCGSICTNSDITLLVSPNTGETYISALQHVLNMDPLPGYLSISWGFNESEQAKDFIEQIDALLQELCLKGVNITAAAGDNLANDGTSTLCTDYPGTSAWVTCCAGTALFTTGNTYNNNTKEVVWNDADLGVNQGTGGGKSMIFKKPSFQNSINLSTMRMVPDIAGVADAYKSPVNFIINGAKVPIGGTSIVSPMICGYYARIGLTKFALPMLYNAPSTCFHDIVTGNNDGYQATKGYDMASGWGSINGIVLEQHLVTNVPTVYITPSQLTFTTNAPKQLTVSKQGGMWSSSDTSIATITSNGLVTPHKNGSCVIHNSYAQNLVNVNVQFPAPPTQPTQPTKPSFQIIPFIPIGSTATFGIETSDASDTVTWVSTNSNICTVNGGLITGIAQGTSNISATQNGQTVSVTVLVG